MKKKWTLLLAAYMFLVAMGAALAEYSPGCLMQPPKEVLTHIDTHFSEFALEDYCEIYDVPDGDYGFALLTQDEKRLLVGYKEKNDKMTYWLKSYGAVMQGKEEAWFSVTQKGDTRYTKDWTPYQAKTPSFSITQLDDAGESYNESIAYRWENGGFRLSGYKDWNEFYGYVNVEENVLHFANEMEGWDFGKVYGVVQRDLRYVNFSKLPKTIDEAKEKLSSAPEIPAAAHHAMTAQEIKFTGGRNYPVYNGPGTQYQRAGNGKASVSTNDWIQVFGRYEGWVLIQYDISSDRYRFGWIDASALPTKADVPELELAWDSQETAAGCTLTDDPLQSETPLCELPAQTQVYMLGWLGETWEYVCVEVDGKTWWGFLRRDCLTHG